jgi:hypothetical protein
MATGPRPVRGRRVSCKIGFSPPKQRKTSGAGRPAGSLETPKRRPRPISPGVVSTQCHCCPRGLRRRLQRSLRLPVCVEASSALPCASSVSQAPLAVDSGGQLAASQVHVRLVSAARTQPWRPRSAWHPTSRRRRSTASPSSRPSSTRTQRTDRRRRVRTD